MTKKTKDYKVVIVMPAYNAAKTVKETFAEIPKEYRKNIILVDDDSTDNTVEVAEKLGIKVFSHSKNLGYGGNQKTCYWEALKLDPDVVVMLHPDYQYDATMIPELIRPIIEGRKDFMFGSRIATKSGALEGGMPPIKYYVNRIVCFIQNILLGVNFTEHFSGFRAYSKKLLKTIPFQRFSNDFVFDQEMTISSISHGFEIGEVPIPTRYHEKASSIRFLKGSKFVLEGFVVILKLYLNKLGLVQDDRFKVPKRSFSFIGLLSVTLIALFNLFVLETLKTNFLMGVVLFVQTLLLASYLLRKDFLKGAIIFAVFILLSVHFLGTYFDSGLFSLTNLEKNTIVYRQGYYWDEFGRLYGNRVGIFVSNTIYPPLEKFTQNAFGHLNLDYYFVYNSLISVALIPFTIYGFLLAVKKSNSFMVMLGLASFLVGGFLSIGQGYHMYVPLISTFAYLGIAKVYELLKNA